AVGSIAVALVVHARERDSFDQRQRSEAIRAAHQAEALAALSVGQLASATAFYRAEGHFSHHEFQVVANSLLHTGGLAATGFIASVSLGDRARLELSHGSPLSERGALGQILPAARRATSFPLVYAATASPVTVTLPLGYDIGSDALRGPYLHRALITGKAAATPVMRLPAGGTGINVFRPVYRDGAATSTTAQRRAAMVGLAV